MEINHKWDNRFRDMCSEIARWSSCLSRQVGAILVRDRTIIATGYNGPPRGIPHCGHERFMSDKSLRSAISNKGLSANPLRFRTECPRKVLGYSSGKGLDLCPAIHAEDNCISNAARTGVITIGSTMYMNCGVPCKDCLKKIINAGIVEIVCTSMTLYDELSDWLMKESNIIVRIYGKEKYNNDGFTYDKKGRGLYKGVIMTPEQAEEIIEAYDYFEDVSCSCHCGNPPCSKCIDQPSEEIYKEALKSLAEGEED